MGLQLTWKIEGDVELHRILENIDNRLKDWTPAFQQTAEYLANIFSQDVFNTEGKAIDEYWAPLSYRYAIKKAKLYPGKGILEATGAMRNGFMTLWRSDMAQVWNTIEYFKYHQSNQPRHVLPRRVMMKLADMQKREVVRTFQKYFIQSVGRTP